MATIYNITPEAQTAKESLEKQGFSFPATPDDDVSLPADVSDLEAKELMALYSLFTAWADYAHAQVGLAVIAERAAERRLEQAEADAWYMTTSTTKKAVTVTASKMLAVRLPVVMAAKAALDECYAYRRLVSDLADRYERDAAVLSRELTRRTSESSPRAARRERWSV